MSKLVLQVCEVAFHALFRIPRYQKNIQNLFSDSAPAKTAENLLSKDELLGSLFFPECLREAVFFGNEYHVFITLRLFGFWELGGVSKPIGICVSKFFQRTRSVFVKIDPFSYKVAHSGTLHCKCKILLMAAVINFGVFWRMPHFLASFYVFGSFQRKLIQMHCKLSNRCCKST